MSTTIDQRVVEMRFDNKHFEENVQTSLSSIEKLRQSLNLTGASKGLNNVDAAAKNVNMTGLSGAVETVRAKFSALEVMGVTALANITNSAVNAGKRIVSALTIDPIKTGFSEYETQINAVQTILANTESKGTTIGDVNKALDELNTYADKTIYNFTEMTRNIGTFTAAGVDLDTATNAIQGIANLAAVSGSTSQQASTAMYQLSQAMASGTVKLMDWNSVVNAGMGGQVFQDALKETARVHGIAIDDMIEEQGSFRETLSEGWLTSEILTETLQKFTLTTEGLTEAQIKENREMLKAKGYTDKQIDAIFKLGKTATDAATKVKTFSQLWDTLKESAQSGWSQTWEIVVGDFEEAKETLTEFSNIIGGMIEASSKARNELLQGWKDAGGRKDLIESVLNLFEAALSIVKPIKEAFAEIFPPITVDKLVGFTRGLKELTEKMKLSDGTADKLKRTFKGIFAIFDIVWQVIKGVGKALGSLLGVSGELGDGILTVTATLGDWLVKLDETIKKSKIFENVFKGIAIVIKGVFSVFKIFAGWVKDGIVLPLLGISDAASSMSDNVAGSFKTISNSIENSGLVKVLKFVWKTISTIATAIGKAVGSIFGELGEAISGLNIDKISGIISSISIAGILAFFAKFTKGVSDVTDSVGSFKDDVLGVLDSVKGCLEAWQSDLKANVLLKIAAAIGILAASILVLSFIEPSRLESALAGITGLFVELIVATSLFSRISAQFGKVAGACLSMITMSVSILILASALKKLEGMNMDSIKNGLLAIAGLSLELVLLSKLLGSKHPKFYKGITSLIIFSAAILMLAQAVKTLGAIDTSELTRGLIAVTVLLTELTIVMKSMPKSISPLLGVTLVGLAGTLLILSGVLHILGRLSWSEIARGLTALAGSLTALVVGLKLMPKKMSAKLSYTLVALASAIAILAGALYIMGGLSWGQIAKGLTAMAVSLLAMSVAMKMMPKKVSANLALGLLALAGAMVVLAGALYVIGSMSWDGISKGLTAIAGSLIIFAIAVKLMNTAIFGAAALLVISAALAILTPVLFALGSMSWDTIAKGLAALAGVFIVLGVASALLTPVIPAMLALGGAVLLLGVGCMSAGIGISLLATGLAALAVSGAAASDALVVILSNILSLIPVFFRQLGEGIKAFAEAIIGAIPAITKALKVVIISLCEMLVECIPVIADTILQLAAGLLEALVSYTPRLVDGIFDFIIAVLDGVAKNIPELIPSIVGIVTSLFQGVANSLGDLDFKTLVEGMSGVGLMAGVMMALAALSALAPAAMIGVLAFGSILVELGLVLVAIGALAQIPGLDWLVNEGGKLMESIGNAIGKLMGGLVGGFAEGVSSSFPQIASDLSKFMTNLKPFIDGAKSIDESVVNGVKSIIDVMLAITGANLLESIVSFITGGSSIVKFSEQLPILGIGLKGFSDSVAGVNPENVKSATDAAKALADMASVIPNQGGIVSWFAGENSIAKFAFQLPLLGKGLKAFSDSVSGISAENIVAAACAAKAVADMASVIPNQGGIVSWFTGDNSIAKFGAELIMLGIGLKGFSVAIAGIVPENMIAAANAAKALAEMTSNIPNEGGVVSWFAGDNSVAKFGEDLMFLGMGLKGFSDHIAGIVPENITAAANAAKALAEMTSAIPNEGGVVGWIAGENSISKFADDLVLLGKGLKGFSDNIAGIVPENIIAAANAAKALAEMTSNIPNEGGVIGWIAGENSISKFADDLVSLGKGLKGFSDNIAGIVPENIIAAANAAKALAEMTSYIPSEGGISAWFTGEKSISKFSDDLISLGKGLKGFSDNVADIVPENVTAAANAAKYLAQLTTYIPKEDGITQWFTGDSSLANFADQLPKLGAGLKGFSDSIAGIVPENVTAAANAAKSLAEMANTIPDEGGIKAWFAGDNSIATFGDKLPQLGEGLKGFSDSVSGIVPENITAAANAAKTLAQMANTTPDDTDKIVSFGGNLASFGDKLKSYFSKTAEISEESISISKKAIDAAKNAASFDASGVDSAAKALTNLTKAVKGMSGITASSTDGFVSAVKNLGKLSVDTFTDTFKTLETKMKEIGKTAMDSFLDSVESSKSKVGTAGQEAVTTFAEGMENKSSSVTSAISTVTKAAVTAAKESHSSFYNAGSYLVSGFASGISENSFKAAAKSRAMAKAAVEAAEDELDINSPSKVGYGIGGFFGLGFVNAIGDYADKSYSASSDMAKAARTGLSDAISKVRDVLNSDMDMQPTIRPVLDLSDVRANAGAIGGMLNSSTSVGVMAKVGAISSAMNNRNQNGGASEVVDAIKALRKDLANVGGTTYSVNGITYDDGSNITEAVKSLVRAAKIERRV